MEEPPRKQPGGGAGAPPASAGAEAPLAVPPGGGRGARSAVLWIAALAVMAALPALAPRQAEGLRGVVQAAGFWAPALFLLLQASRSFTWLPGNVLTPIGGFLFGFWEGSALSWVGVILACMLGYEGARWLGRGRLRRGLERGLPRLLGALEVHGWKGVLLGRLLPGIPLSPVSYAAGLAGMPRLPYLAGSAAGMFPRVILQTLVGVWAQSLAA